MRYVRSKKKSPPPANPQEIITEPLSASLQENHANLQRLLEKCSDAVFKEFTFGPDRNIRGLLVFFDGLVDRQEIEIHLLKPLLLELNMQGNENQLLSENNIFKVIEQSILTMADLKAVDKMGDLVHHLSSGDTILLIDGYGSALVSSTRSWKGRSVETPDSEVVVRGPKEGFTETLRFNTALLRRRIKSTNFKMEGLVLGRITKTDVVMCYIEGIAPKELVEDVKKRLEAIDIDGILDTGYLEEFLEDNHWTIFSQMEYSEKPDRVCGHLLEGHVSIMVDGSPIVLIVPTSFPRFLIASEDYYERYIPSSLFRIMRLISFMVALLLPSLFVAAITYHPEMVPSSLYLTIASAREGVPFPAFVEALILELTFEMLREAGLRLPRSIGPAISIVGALIIGDAAVKAGLVSTPMVVVVAFTGISSFISPSYNAGIVIRIARFGFLAAAGVLGLFGIMIVLLLMLIHMVSLRSFGMPYMSPVAPFNPGQISDIIVRRPWFMNHIRPTMKGMTNAVRQESPDSSEK